MALFRGLRNHIYPGLDTNAKLVPLLKRRRPWGFSSATLPSKAYRRDEEISSRPLGHNVGFLEGNCLSISQRSKLLLAAGTVPIIMHGSTSFHSNSSDCAELWRGKLFDEIAG
jgi:hypothetical protein